MTLGRVVLTTFQGLAGDRNPRAMRGSVMLGDALAKKLGSSQTRVGVQQVPLLGTWDQELQAASAGLSELAHRYDQLLSTKCVPLSVINRCAVALATLPVVARYRPDACVVWFDAHADCNTPTSVSVPYLGGMVISGAAGLWDSGFGAHLELSNVVLVGSRDIDPDEQALIDAGAPRLVKVGRNLPTRLLNAVGDRPVYIHLDCDVLEPGILPTEYLSPGGLTLDELREAFEALAQREIIGLEIAEFEASWPQTEILASPVGLLDAVAPVLDALCSTARARHA